MKHDKCGYSWKPRTENPKRCPFCQGWLKKNKIKKELGQNGKAVSAV